MPVATLKSLFRSHCSHADADRRHRRFAYILQTGCQLLGMAGLAERLLTISFASFARFLRLPFCTPFAACGRGWPSFSAMRLDARGSSAASSGLPQLSTAARFIGRLRQLDITRGLKRDAG